MVRRCLRHASRLARASGRMVRPDSSMRRAGAAAQEAVRALEAEVRRTVLVTSRWARRLGVEPAELALRLGLSARTLSQWATDWRAGKLRPVERGRPAEALDRATREEALGLLEVLGPEVGLAVLRGFFPEAAREALADILRRYRRVCLRRGEVATSTLRWKRPGTVWAMDYTEPEGGPVDGVYRWVLVARDLASGQMLAARPVEAPTARTTADVLRALFAGHGAPAVLKSDNGSHFTAEDVRSLLRQHDVLLLLSPPRTPRYNGAVEAGIGSLATRAHHIAARNGRPEEWTCDDVEGARRMANETARPHGHAGPTPEELWRARAPLAMLERERFRETYEHRVTEARTELGLPDEGPLGPRDRDRVDRLAIGRALVEHGLVEYRRRRIAPAFSSRKRAKISR